MHGVFDSTDLERGSTVEKHLCRLSGNAVVRCRFGPLVGGPFGKEYVLWLKMQIERVRCGICDNSETDEYGGIGFRCRPNPVQRAVSRGLLSLMR